mmetsp:Transcript_808/g.5042  ORF Transcript_808/g.5042 Transcript_808/m.5042 type:complete len:229 (-) Transcript_808:1299-1985(-)
MAGKEESGRMSFLQRPIIESVVYQRTITMLHRGQDSGKALNDSDTIPKARKNQCDSAQLDMWTNQATSCMAKDAALPTTKETVRNTPKTSSSCRIFSPRFRQRTWVYVIPPSCMHLIASRVNTAGINLWNAPSMIRGSTKRTNPPSNFLETSTRFCESFARALEKATMALLGSLPCSSKQLSNISTSSRAEFSPRPKYGLTTWIASPRSTVLPSACKVGPLYWNSGKL